MNDQIDEKTQELPAPEPVAAQATAPETAKPELHPEAANWRKVAIATTSAFAVTLALLGWQLADGNYSAFAGHKFNDGRGGQFARQQMGGQGPGQGPGGNFGGSGQSQGGPPPMSGQQFQGGQGNQSGPPSTHAS